jgi:hypothetical protein
MLYQLPSCMTVRVLSCGSVVNISLGSMVGRASDVTWCLGLVGLSLVTDYTVDQT